MRRGPVWEREGSSSCLLRCILPCDISSDGGECYKRTNLRRLTEGMREVFREPNADMLLLRGVSLFRELLR